MLQAVLDDPRHPLTPAAIRIERSSARSESGTARQTAFTVWFSEGPSLPGPTTSGPSARAIAGTVAGVVGVLALGALGVLAAQRQPQLLGDEEPPRLLQPSRSAEPPSPTG
jgi:hypothetical protein